MNASDAVRGLFESFERGGVDAALEALAPDAMLVVGPETSAEPDTYEGPEGGQRYFAGFEGALDDIRFEVVEIHHDTPAALVATVKLSGVGAATRIPVEQSVMMAFLVRDGLITRIASHPTLESAQADAGITPE